MQVFIVSVIYH